jgi:thiol:disulfide interchange protein DsbD
MKIKNQLLLTVSFLSYLAFSSCSDKKPDANDKEKNPFGITSDTGSQILQPCHWSFTVEQSVNGEAILVSTAKLDPGWHLYSQYISDKGPRTEFVYDSSHIYKLLGNTEEDESRKEYNPYLEMEVLYFEKEAVFEQKIKVLSETDFTITGTLDYMVCLDQSQCVHSDEEFSFKVKGNPWGK